MASGSLSALTGLRGDGRRPQEGRRVRCALGVLSRGGMGGLSGSVLGMVPGAALWGSSADGSAYLEMGSTKVLAVVHGPRSPERRLRGDKGVLAVECWSAPFAGAEHRKVRDKKDRKSVEMAAGVKGALGSAVMLEKYAGSEITVHLSVLQADGGELAACINAASIAIADAGISMRDLVVASTAALVDRTPVLDPSYAESTLSASATLPVALLPKSNALSLVKLAARIPIAHFDDLLALAALGCRQTHDALRAALREDTAKRAKKE